MARPGRSARQSAGTAAELTYWHLTGGFHAGRAADAVQGGRSGDRRGGRREARDALCALIDAYDAPDRCYLSQPQPGLAPRFSDYAQLARVAEWAAAEDEG